VDNAPRYAALVQTITRHFRPQGIKISVSFGASWAEGYLPLARAVAGTVDSFNLQFYFSTNNAMPLPVFAQRLNKFLEAGVTAKQIRVGLPSYAMVNKKATNTSDLRRSWDQLLAAHVDVANQNQWTDPANGETYYFSSLKLLKEKIDYVKEHGFAGVFSWELTLDTHYNDPRSADCLLDKETLGLSSCKP
jgi:hypothetical protein